MQSGVTSKSLCLPLYLMKKDFSWEQYQYAWSLGSRLSHTTVRYLNSPCSHHYPSPFWEISKLFLFSHPRKFTFTLARSPLQLETHGKVSRKHDYILTSIALQFIFSSFLLSSFHWPPTGHPHGTEQRHNQHILMALWTQKKVTPHRGASKTPAKTFFSIALLNPF